MTNKLFVAGLSYSATDRDLEQLFSQAGSVVSAKVITDRFSGQSKGFGFVEMGSSEEAQNAMKMFDNTVQFERTIVVKEARPQADTNKGFRSGRDERRPREKFSRNR